MSATGTHATASVVPSCSASRGSASSGHGGREHQADGVEVLEAPRRRGAAEVVVVHGDQLADRALDAALLADLAHHRGARRLAVVDAAAGQRPGAGVEAALRDPHQQHARRRGGPARRRPAAGGGTAGGRRAPPAPSARPARCPSSTPSSGCQAASTVEPSTSTTRGWRGVDRHPAVVHDPQRVRVDPVPVAPHARQVRGVDPGGLADRRRPARSPRAPRGRPRRAGPRRGRARRRAASRAPRR